MPRLVSSMWDAFGSRGTAAIGSRHLVASFRRGPVLWLILSGALLVAAIIVGTVVMVSEFRERALSNSERELENTVLLLTRHFDQLFEDTDIMANDFISQMQFSKIASPEIFRSRMSNSRRASDVEIQGQRLVLHRRRHYLRLEREVDQLIGTWLFRAWRRRPAIFQNPQIEPAIGNCGDPTVSQHFHRRGWTTIFVDD